MRLPSVNCELFITNKCNMACKYCYQKNHGKESMSVEDVEDILKDGGFSEIMLFGGEPLLNLDFIEKAIEIVKNSDRPEALKKKLIKKLRKQATNGTLIKNNLEKIKQLDLKLQVSVDGCREAHNLNRVFPNESGTYDEIISSLVSLKDEGFKPTIHAVIGKTALPYFYRTVRILFSTEEILRGLDSAIDMLRTNSIMFVIEDDYDDNDIDILIDQFEQLFAWFEEKYDKDTLEKIYKNLNSKVNIFCPAGMKQFLFDKNDNVYICHRSTNIPLGTSENFDPRISNAIYSSKNRGTFIPYDFSINYDSKEYIPLFRCSSTYYAFNQSVFMSPAKYSTLIMEVSAYLMQKVESK